MNNRPVHENLDTSFVDLPALVKHLQRGGFVGRVRLEMSGYRAEIYLFAENRLKAREGDRNSAADGAEDESVLRRIFLRASEPGGLINIYQIIDENETPMSEMEETSGETSRRFAGQTLRPAVPAAEYGMLLDLTAELLETIDRSLAKADLDFSSAFAKARSEISADYPFLPALRYAEGKITGDAPVNPQMFVAGMLEALGRIFDRLGANPRFAEVYRLAAQQVLALIYRRKPLYDKFSMTSPIERMLGIN